MFRKLALFVFALCLAYPAWGAEPAKKPIKPEPGTSVELPFLMVPMSKDGDLLGYNYVASKLICTSPGGAIRVRAKLAFIQDAFVREVNGRPVSLATDPKALDKDLLSDRLTAAARRIVGNETVRAILFMEIKYAPLHPGDSTAGGVPPPEQNAATATSDGAGKADGGAKSASSEGATSKPGSGH
jgi:hypothetical protein